jgi:hypothetical protein
MPPLAFDLGIVPHIYPFVNSMARKIFLHTFYAAADVDFTRGGYILRRPRKYFNVKGEKSCVN